MAAVDLGASSGRVIAARVDARGITLDEVHRFANGPIDVGGSLRWDLDRLHAEVLDGLRAAARRGPLDGVGIDSWAVDYGLLDRDGTLLGPPVHYRDRRTDGVMDRVLAELPAADVYATTGIQFLPFNTAFQLVAAAGSDELAAADRLLLIPDLLSWLLTGVAGAEITNASTTQLLDVRARAWSGPLMAKLGISPALFPALREPGDPAGALLPSVQRTIGVDGPVPVTAVGSHDTASAVVGVPAGADRFAFISCGTWSLVGVELDRPVLSEASRQANFTNELGVDHTVRYLRNVMGLWLLQESVRTWTAEEGREPDLSRLLAEAADAPAFASLVDPDVAVFLPPGDQPARLADECRRRGERPPPDRAGTVRLILESLALAYRRTLRLAQELADVEVSVVHLVGGGARNPLLCQLTADACGLTVLAGPVEASALGNAVVQARALGAVRGGLPELRALVRGSVTVDRYDPTGDPARWAAAEHRVHRDRGPTGPGGYTG